MWKWSIFLAVHCKNNQIKMHWVVKHFIVKFPKTSNWIDLSEEYAKPCCYQERTLALRWPLLLFNLTMMLPFCELYTLRKVQVCTPKVSQYQHSLGRNLAPQNQVCTHKGAISLSLHLAYLCTHQSAKLHEPVIFAHFRLQKCFNLSLQTWLFGVQTCTPIRKGTSLLPKGAAKFQSIIREID